MCIVYSCLYMLFNQLLNLPKEKLCYCQVFLGIINFKIHHGYIPEFLISIVMINIQEIKKMTIMSKYDYTRYQIL